MYSIRNLATRLAAAVALTAIAGIQAQAASEHTPPAEPAIESIATKQQQDEAMSLMSAYLGLWMAEDPDRYAFEQFVTEDAVFEYPYAGEALRRIEGRQAIGQAFRRLPAMASNWTVTDLQLYQTLYADIFYFDYTVKADVPATQGTYESHHVARITVRDGKIAAHYELWDSDASTAAFGAGCPQLAEAPLEQQPNAF